MRLSGRALGPNRQLIMEESAGSGEVVDVRDMLCAQALARVARSAQRIEAGACLEIICNAADVKRDLLIWAGEQGHALDAVEEHGEEVRVRIRRRRA